MQRTLQRLVEFDEIFDDEIGVVLADPQFGGTLKALHGFLASILFGRRAIVHSFIAAN